MTAFPTSQVQRFRSRWLGAASTLLVLAACTGNITTPGGENGAAPGSSQASGSGAGGSGSTNDPPLGTDPEEIAAACAETMGELDVGLTRLRRLTRDQLDNTLRDLLGITAKPSQALAPDERIGPFHSNAIAPVTDLLVEQHKEIAANIAEDAEADMADIAPCDLAADSGTDCAVQFVEEFGSKAYRRPLTDEEVDAYVTLYTLGRDNAGASHGFRLVLEAMLQAPSFLYHADVGVSGTPEAAPVAVTQYELASRLSYFLWNSMPDDELFAAAANGTLADESELAVQVERMLADSKADATIALFHRQWLGLEDLVSREKDAEIFPQYDAALAEAMLRENATFSTYVVKQGDALMKTLFTADFGFPEGALFDIYGVSEPADFVAGTPVQLDPTRRAGLLTQAAFLTRNAHQDQTSPVHRGILVRENVLCQPIQPPPANVNAVAPEPTESTSTRERFANHSADPACGGCHMLMDPIGMGFEHYDAVGAYREEDGLGPVDASGELTDVRDDLAGPFNGAIELANKLAESGEVAACLANQWFRFSLGRVESRSDACSIQAIHQGFQASGGDIRQLLAQIALSDAFRNVRATAEESN